MPQFGAIIIGWMSSPSSTVMVLVPGRSTLCFELDGRVWQAVLAALLVPFMLGATARRCFDAWYGRAPSVASLLTAHPVSGSLLRTQRLLTESAPSAREMSDVLGPVFASAAIANPAAVAWPEPPATRRSQPAGDVVASTKTPSSAPGKAKLGELTPERATELVRGNLRLEAVHFGEAIELTPFDAAGQPQSGAFDALRHLMRCRITGDEADMDPRLIRILTQLSTLYGRAIQLVSGHRKSHAIGTKPTSQHVLGRAADIRIPGVSIEELRTVAIKLGARGVGLYPEKGFVHVDVREKPKYFWTYSADEGEEADGRPPSGFAPVARHLVASAD